MQALIYHILPEAEPFSEYLGGAISRWVANVLQGDDSGVVVCPTADGTWKLKPSQVKQLPLFRQYGRYRALGNKIGWPLRTLLLRGILRPALRFLKPGDIVWVHNRPDLAAAIRPVVHARQAKLILHMHNSHLAKLSSARAEEICADRYVFVSNYLQSEAMEAHKGIANSRVLYNGANSAIFYPRAEEPAADQAITILFASRLVHEKGAHIFVEAMRELHRRNVPVHGILVGASNFGGSKETPYIRSLRERAPSNISFHPYCVGADLGDMFRLADIFCLPSVWDDPFPLAPLEAMASALPVVATRSGGIPEALHDGGGVIVARNSVSELAIALELVATDPILRRELAQAGLVSFQRNFTWTAVQKHYMAIASELYPQREYLQAVGGQTSY